MVAVVVLWSLCPPFILNGDLDIALDSHVLFFMLSVSLLTAVLIGLAPAIKVARPNLIEVLKVGGRGGSVVGRATGSAVFWS